jgi:hypothetical protein
MATFTYGGRVFHRLLADGVHPDLHAVRVPFRAVEVAPHNGCHVHIRRLPAAEFPPAHL